MKSKHYINWVNTLFLIFIPIIAIVGTVVLYSLGLFSWQTVCLAIFLTVMGGLSITAGYHRLFSHKTYKANGFVRLLFILFGAGTFEGPVLEWCTDHRDHHRYTDTPKDPYNFQQGFWYAHIGWLLTLDPKKRNFSNVDDLNRDRMVQLQHRFYLPLSIFMGFAFPMLLASLWGDAWGGLIIAGALRITISQHMTFCINSVCHAFGKQTYSDRNSARDNWFTALFTFGEGYHNFHHKFPLDYRNGIRVYDFDPTKWLIQALASMRFATDLKRVAVHRIIQNRLDMDQKRLSTIDTVSISINEKAKAELQSLYQYISQLLLQRDKLETAYKNLKTSKLDYMQGQAKEYRRLTRMHYQELKVVTSNLKYSMKMWTQLMKQTLLPADSNYESQS